MNYKTTTIILTKNHEDIISQTLESIRNLGPVIVADLGSKDNTVSVCEKAEAKVYKTPFDFDFSQIRNKLLAKVNTDWVFWINPGEVLSSGQEYFEIEKPDSMYRVMLLSDDLLTKQTRLFKKGIGRFKKPVFEEIDPDLSEQTLPVVITGSSKLDFQMIQDSLMRWKDKEPLSPDPNYYQASVHLMCGRYEQFLNIADQFLFLKGNSTDASAILTKYYVAMLMRKKDTGKALKLILECIAAYPLMAEFWCFLGDLYLFPIKEYDRAYQFYDNAIVLGSQRLAEDTMPMEISKYDEYPRKMMNIIKNAIQSAVGTDSSSGVP